MTGRVGVCSVSSAVLFILALSLPVGASAAPKPVTGKLSKPGYTVIAVAASGQARTDRAPKGKFAVKPPTRRVTLHLRGPGGRYAGPIVLGSLDRGRRAVVGVRAGAHLGQIQVKPSMGYAKVRKPPRAAIDQDRLARAKHGVPIGAGRFGFVRSKPPKNPPAGDRDFDGIPAALDIDDDGDLVLDDYDRSAVKSAASPSARTSQSSPEEPPQLWVGTSLSQGSPVNADGGSSDAQIGAAQRESGRLDILWDGFDSGSGQLDCGVLVYCSAGGTGRFVRTERDSRAVSPPYPGVRGGEFDPDGNGLGSLLASTGIERPMSLFHGATDDQLRAGDVLIAKGEANGEPVEAAYSITFVYSTFPVIASYDDGQGNSMAFSYPRPPCHPNVPDPCVAPVRAGEDGDVVLRLRVWRPQRRRLESEPGEGRWMDVGNLSYAVLAGQGFNSGMCPESSYLAIDPNFTLDTSKPAQGKGEIRYVDPSHDRPASAANSFGLTLNLTQCLAANGVSPSTTTPVSVSLSAFNYAPNGPTNHTASGVNFLLQP
jgi:hypothetical protein